MAALLHGVSILELCLVIAMKHVHECSEGEAFNFEMVYNGRCVCDCVCVCARCLCHHVCVFVYPEYKKFAQRAHSVEFFGKPVALKVLLENLLHFSLKYNFSLSPSLSLLQAFEHLISLEVVCPANSAASGSIAGSNKLLKEFRPMVLMLEEDQIAMAIKKYPNCPTDVTRWGTLAGIV